MIDLIWIIGIVGFVAVVSFAAQRSAVRRALRLQAETEAVQLHQERLHPWRGIAAMNAAHAVIRQQERETAWAWAQKNPAAAARARARAEFIDIMGGCR